MGQAVIALHGVSKSYRIYTHPRYRLLEALWRGRRRYHRDFWALSDVSLEVAPGETLGVIGLNGSGKSTLLQLIAGIVQPTTGRIAVHGRLASLLELGAGFDPEFTGRENVRMQGAILGLDPAETEARLPAIEAFAEIGSFIDQPVRTYSSGMFVRLAFAAAIHIDPEILLVDEALAVGDAVFQHRCIRTIQKLQAEGRTICFVTHDTGLVKAICSRVLWLDAGVAQAIGAPAEVVNLYHAHVARRESPPASPPPAVVPGQRPAAPAVFRPDPRFDQRVGFFRHGTGAARIRNVEVLDPDGQPVAVVDFDQELVLRIHLEFYADAPTSILGFFVRDKNGIDLVGTNTCEEDVPLPARGPGDSLVVDFRLAMPLMPGSYSVTAGLAYSRSSTSYFDWVDNAALVEVLPPRGKHIHTKVWLPVRIHIHG